MPVSCQQLPPGWHAAGYHVIPAGAPPSPFFLFLHFLVLFAGVTRCLKTFFLFAAARDTLPGGSPAAAAFLLTLTQKAPVSPSEWRCGLWSETSEKLFFSHFKWPFMEKSAFLKCVAMLQT